MSSRPDAPHGAAEVFLVFLRLGLHSFGGPIAHLGYFRTEFVERRRWLAADAYGELIGLCQFLPGPSSSQVGFSIGLLRAGYGGALAAWAGFTLPSAILMALLATVIPSVAATTAGAALLHGLQLMAVAVVAQAVLGMARTLCPDRVRATIAVGAALAAVLLPAGAIQVAVILCAGILGIWVCSGSADGPATLPPVPVSRRTALICLTLFAVLLVLPWLRPTGVIGTFGAFYRSGALVFGGGHVVLPLLRDAVVGPGWVGEGNFLTGYGLAQAMPGPLFTFAAYLGATMRPGGVGGAVLALVAIFLPGLLLVVGTLPIWAALRGRPAAQAALRGVNAAVVGLLAAALYTPIWTGTVLAPLDFAIALAAFLLLVAWRASPLLVAGLAACAGLI